MSTGSRPEVHASFRFTVEFNGAAQGYFTECTLPTLEVEVEEQKEGGYNTGTHLLPGRVKRGTVTLKHGLTSSSELLRWYMKVLEGKSDVKFDRKKVSIIHHDCLGKPVMRWDFENAFPIKWSGPALDSSASRIAIETLELAFQWVMVS